MSRPVDCSPPAFSVHGIFWARILEWVAISFFRGILPNQGSNPHLPPCRQILYQLSHQGSPSIVEWVVNPFSRGSSWPRNQNRVSCISGEFFTSWGPGNPNVSIGLPINSKTAHVKTSRKKFITSCQKMGKKSKQWQIIFSWASKSLWMVTADLKLKDACSLEEKLWQT